MKAILFERTMEDTKQIASENRNGSDQIGDSESKDSDGKSADSNNDIKPDNDSSQTQTKNSTDGEQDTKIADSTKINIESKDEFKEISSSDVQTLQDNTVAANESTVEGTRQSEHKKHATFSEEAPTITITGEDSCPQSPREAKSDEQEVNNNTEKPITDEAESKGRCPIYFGIKSYLHQFYAPPDKDVLNSGEYIQEDDFEFVVEPGKRRWRGFWFRVGMWVGINMLLLGLIALLVGYLTPPRQTIVGRKDNLEILDRWAIAFNHRLEICRFVGLCVFCCGAVIVMLTLLVSSYQQETTYYVMGATVVPEMFVGNPLVGHQQRWNNAPTSRIPITGTVRNIQPSVLTSN